MLNPQLPQCEESFCPTAQKPVPGEEDPTSGKKKCPESLTTLKLMPAAAGKAERGLDLILIPDPGSCHCTIKDLREKGKDFPKHSKLIMQKYTLKK